MVVLFFASVCEAFSQPFSVSRPDGARFAEVILTTSIFLGDNNANQN